MKERTVTIALGSAELEVYAGNMALVRYRRAGGSVARLELIDRLLPEGEPGEEPEAPPLSHDEMFEAAEIAAEFLHANLVEPGRTLEDLVNLSGRLGELVGGYVKAAVAVPWLFGAAEEPAEAAGGDAATSTGSGQGELAEEGATDSSRTGPSPSSSLAGTRTASGSLAVASGAT